MYKAEQIGHSPPGAFAESHSTLSYSLATFDPAAIMTEAPEEWSIESSWIFRDSNYSVSADVREDVLVLQVEEKLTGNRWRGQFEPKRKYTNLKYRWEGYYFPLAN